MDISSLTTTKRLKFQYWLNIIHECRASGLTNREWCEQNNISLKCYYYWIAKFRKLALEDLPRKTSASAVPVIQIQDSCEPSTTGFVEIPVVAPEHISAHEPVAVLHTGDISIELYGDAPEAFLQKLMKAVQKC